MRQFSRRAGYFFESAWDMPWNWSSWLRRKRHVCCENSWSPWACGRKRERFPMRRGHVRPETSALCAANFDHTTSRDSRIWKGTIVRLWEVKPTVFLRYFFEWWRQHWKVIYALGSCFCQLISTSTSKIKRWERTLLEHCQYGSRGRRRTAICAVHVDALGPIHFSHRCGPWTEIRAVHRLAMQVDFSGCSSTGADMDFRGVALPGTWQRRCLDQRTKRGQ